MERRLSTNAWINSRITSLRPPNLADIAVNVRFNEGGNLTATVFVMDFFTVFLSKSLHHRSEYSTLVEQCNNFFGEIYVQSS